MFSFDVRPYKKKDGGLTNIILVTGDNIDKTFDYKEEMKGYGAKWIGALNTWGWWGSPDENKLRTIIQTMVKPAIEFLLSKEKNPSNDKVRTVESVLDELLAALSTEDTEAEIKAANNVFMSQNDIKNKIQEFKGINKNGKRCRCK